LSGENVELLTRLDAVEQAITSMNGALSMQESLEEALEQVARNALAAVADADAVSITVLGDGAPRTVACTDEFVAALDAEQYSGGGPCVEAAQSGRPVRVAMRAAEQSWPQFVAAAQAAGVQATLSIPLLVTSDGGDGAAELAGSLNAYSRRTMEFDRLDEKLLSLYTGVASQAVDTARRWQRLRHTVSQLEDALVSRSEIDQAKGALRVINGGSADDAFASLVERSQRDNVKVRDLARQILEELSRSLPPRAAN
jgi:transcriptional regulator with GAF, ATPase, and Fis domain